MDAGYEKKCIDALELVCREKYSQSEFSIGSKMDSAVCLLKKSNKWTVLEAERNAEYNVSEHSTLTRREQEIPHLYRWRDELR